jgi:hypothetical protein
VPGRIALHPHDYEKWLHGSFEDAVSFQTRCFPDELIEMTRTTDPWVKRTAPAATGATLL